MMALARAYRLFLAQGYGASEAFALASAKREAELSEPKAFTVLDLDPYAIIDIPNPVRKQPSLLPQEKPMLAYKYLCALRQYAAFTGVKNIKPTETGDGVRGAIAAGGNAVDVALVVLDSGVIELQCLSGPENGMRAEVSTLEELAVLRR